MNILKYFKSKFMHIISFLIFEIILVSILSIINTSSMTVLFISILSLIGFIVPLAVEFIIKYRFYSSFSTQLDKIDKKTLILEIVEQPEFFEGQILFEILKIVNKDMNDEISYYKYQSKEYMEYIGLWIHEIKTPIAVSKLIASNNRNKEMESILEELDSIERHVEQVLYYSKSFTTNYDFSIEKISLDELVGKALKKNAKQLIGKNVKIEKMMNNLDVYTDSKWLIFIMSQMITNSIQFMDKENKTLKFEAVEFGDEVLLSIEDNGMGITESDLSKVFLKGYVGSNGRRVGKSTGFGLYICKRLCDDLDIDLKILSVVGHSTKITLSFVKARS